MENEEIEIIDFSTLPKKVRNYIYKHAKNDYLKYIHFTRKNELNIGMCAFIKNSIICMDTNKSFISTKTKNLMNSFSKLYITYNSLETLPEFKAILDRYKDSLRRTSYIFPTCNYKDRLMLFNEMIEKTK